jgi:hypothetical protein
MLHEPQIEAIISLYGSLNETISAEWLIKTLGSPDYGKYSKSNRIIRDAIAEGLLYVDSIKEDADFMLGLTKWGQAKWYELNEEEDEE